ncbi:protein KRI1 homolog [Bradysia coprophila]|uniref:protein KRI1 homolog n=1 Tax=Bradysia coprophila TaxID=38358 RepID=UPI00187D89F9|nr:protein KRI1 homolog [Bradysia coprophila]
MSSKQLFDNDSDSDENGSGFNTNKEYAKSYNKFRSKELLKKVKDLAQSTSNKTSNFSDDSSSDSDSTDNETVDPKFDEAFFQALATLKKRDSSTYDANVKFFEDFDDVKIGGEKKGPKALTVKDYERKILLEKGGIYEDEADDNDTDLRPSSPAYNQEQMNIKNAFKKVIEEDDDDDEDNEWGGIFRKREKTKEEEATEEEQYTKWLAGEEANIGTKAQELKPLKEYWNNPKLSKDEKFLRDYILSNGYSKSDKDDVPTYDEIVGDESLEISEDEAELERQAEFEHKFNFRFEEPDNEFIKRYPRTIDHSVRKQDNRRKEKRAEVKERKLNEKKEKMKELEMINAIRKREIEEKIKKLKDVTGDDTIPFDDDDIDGDFDPDEYDRKMNEIFNNEYYQVDEGETKPDCPDIEDLKVDDWDNYDPVKDDADDINDGHCEDDDFVMDCDYDPEQQRKSLQDELIENSRDKRKRRKRRSKFVEMLKKEKPVFDPDDEKTYGEYLDEYYKLDYEDIIGDTPCRFKYVETVPNDFGLTVEEILLAKNKELNAWASLKKATQIRPDHVELNEVKTFKNKAKNEYLKRKILPSLYGEGSDDDDDEDGKADTAAEATVPNRKRKISEEKIEKSTPEKSDEKISAQKERKKAKTEEVSNPTKVTGDSGKTTKGLNIEKTPDVAVKPKMKEVLKTEKPKKQPVKKKANILMPKKVVSTKSTVHKKEAATIPNQQRKTKKVNSALLKKGGIKKKTARPQNNKSSTSTFSKKPSISDERLRAFGLNPKKFHKKLKYGNKSTGSATPTTSKKEVTKNNKVEKLNQKKIKQKLLKVLGS